MKNYTPEIGHGIEARRKVKSKIYDNTVVGPVTNLDENALNVTINSGTDIESNFRLFFNDWDFKFLFDMREREI